MNKKEKIKEIKKIIKQIDSIIEELEALAIFSGAFLVEESHLAARWSLEDGRDTLVTIIAELNEMNKQ